MVSNFAWHFCDGRPCLHLHVGSMFRQQIPSNRVHNMARHLIGSHLLGADPSPRVPRISKILDAGRCDTKTVIRLRPRGKARPVRDSFFGCRHELTSSLVRCMHGELIKLKSTPFCVSKGCVVDLFILQTPCSLL